MYKTPDGSDEWGLGECRLTTMYTQCYQKGLLCGYNQRIVTGPNQNWMGVQTFPLKLRDTMLLHLGQLFMLPGQAGKCEALSCLQIISENRDYRVGIKQAELAELWFPWHHYLPQVQSRGFQVGLAGTLVLTQNY